VTMSSLSRSLAGRSRSIRPQEDLPSADAHRSEIE